MANQISIKESMQTTVAGAIDAMDGAATLITQTIVKLQALRGEIPDDSWLQIVDPLLQRQQSLIAATQSLQSELDVMAPPASDAGSDDVAAS